MTTETTVLELVTKRWPRGIPVTEYSRAATFIADLQIALESGVRAVEAVRAVAQAAPLKRAPGRPKKETKPPAAKNGAKKGHPAASHRADSKTDLATKFLSASEMTAAELKKAIGGTSNVYILLERVGAKEVGKTQDGKKLYSIPHKKTGTADQ